MNLHQDQIERAQKIRRAMMRAGFDSAAEEFMERFIMYTAREFDRIERAWSIYNNRRALSNSFQNR